MSFFSGKKLLLVGFVIVLLVAIPLTVYLVQKQQQTKSSAAPSTNLTFSPAAPASIKVGDTVKLDVSMDPGTNQISFVKLIISYDATKLQAQSGDLVPNTDAFPGGVLEGPTYESGKVSVTLSVGADPAKVIKTLTKVATITFKALAATDTPTNVTFGSDTQTLSIASSDQASENVLLSKGQAAITIAQAAGPTPTPTVTTTPGPGTPSSNKTPVCTSLEIDRAATGVAPYAVTFTAKGTDSDGTISKVTFNFGDGKSENVTQSGGIGTASVSAQISHTYQNAGTFSASAVLTDNNNAVSTDTTCTKTITVTAGSASSSGGASSGTGTGIGSSLGTSATAAPTVAPPKTPPGPGNKFVGLGIAGGVLSAIGVLLFLAL